MLDYETQSNVRRLLNGIMSLILLPTLLSKSPAKFVKFRSSNHVCSLGKDEKVDERASMWPADFERDTIEYSSFRTIILRL